MEQCKCPVCGRPGQEVPVETVRSLAMGDLPAGEEFAVCLDPDCDVVYFGRTTVFRRDAVRVPVSWKRGASPKYVCYCGRVTEDDVVRAVRDSGAQTVADIARLTGAMKNGKCLTNNPKGICCHGDIAALIERTLAED